MNKEEVKKLESYIYGGIFVLSNKLQQLGDKFDENISIKQWFLIAIILRSKEEAPTISSTAEKVGTSRQNIKKMANILEKRGFLKIVKDNKDGRIQRLELTDYCIEYFKKRNKREEKYIENLFKGFDEEMLLAIYKSFSQLEENIIRMVRCDEEE